MRETDAEIFSSKLRDASRRITSPMAVWETVVNVSKGLDIDLETARLEVGDDLFQFKKHHKVPLLYMGDDFAHTDIETA